VSAVDEAEEGASDSLAHFMGEENLRRILCVAA